MLKLEEVHDCLMELSPVERAFKGAYEQLGRLVTLEELMGPMGEQVRLQQRIPFESPLLPVMAEYTVGSGADASMTDGLATMHFRLLHEQRTFLVQRQCRFAPVMVTDAQAAIITYAYRGSGTFLVRKDRSLVEVKLAQGDLLLVAPPFQGAHRIEREDAAFVAFAVRPEVLMDVIRSGLPEGPVSRFYQILLGSGADADGIVLRTGDDKFVQACVLQLVCEASLLGTSPAEGAQAINLVMTALLAHAQKEYGADAPALGRRGYVGSIPVMVQYIKDHLLDFSLDDMARHFSFSRVYMSRYFKKNAGVTIRDTLRDLRMERAEHELHYGQASVAEIAYDCGFSNTSHFIEVFKERFGMTPCRYRESCS